MREPRAGEQWRAKANGAVVEINYCGWLPVPRSPHESEWSALYESEEYGVEQMRVDRFVELFEFVGAE